MKICSLTRLTALITACLALGHAAAAADTPSAVSPGDASFLQSAWKSGIEEIAVSRAALPNLTNVLVQQFAQTMVNDHSPAGVELTALAGKRGVVLSEMRVDVSKWEKKTDADFDKNYLEKMIKDHEEVVNLFAKASEKSDDPEIQAFAKKTLGTLEAHLAQATELRKSLKI